MILKTSTVAYAIIALGVVALIGVNAISILRLGVEHDFLEDKRDVFDWYKYPLYIHILSAVIAAILALCQWVLPKRWLHRSVGKIYAVLVLVLVAPSGLWMSFYSSGGWVGKLLFVALSVLTWYYTFKAYSTARKRALIAHQRWAMGSLILLNSAILLRILMYVFHSQDLFGGNRYVVAVFLSWVPLLLFHEIRSFLINRK